MPKFKITKTLPATMTWVYEIEAASKEEAIELIQEDEVDEINYDCELDMYADYKYEVEVKNN